MKSRKINEIFDHPEYGKLQVCAEGAENECYGCVFDNPKRCGNDPDRIHTGACAASVRPDNTGVIFKKYEEKGGTNA